MVQSIKFPPSVEIKRAIAAAIRAGIEIGSVEIQPRKITIRPKEPNEKISAYDLWKMSDGERSRTAKHSDE